jgi:hypothetical protein
MPAPSNPTANPFYDPSRDLAGHVQAYQRSGDLGALLDALRQLATHATPEALKGAARPYADMPEVIVPLYERIVAEAPTDAQAMVVLANSYWLSGRGPDVVGQLAARAKAIDPANRGAWHLWALAESNIRRRTERWLEVTRAFPHDQLARAALADNATSLASEEDDPVALKLAIDTYENLLAETTQTAQRLALEETLQKLKNWHGGAAAGSPR